HDQRAAVGVLLDKTLEVAADLVLHDAVVAAFFLARFQESAGDDVAGVAQQVRVVGDEAASGDFGLALDLAGALVDGDDGKEDAVFTEMLAVADHGVFDDVGSGVVVDADAAGGDFAGLVGGVCVESKYVAVFEQKHFLGDAGGNGQFDVTLEVPVVAVHRNEELGLDEVDHQAKFFLRAVAADMDKSVGAVVVDHASVAALKVVDDAIDFLFVTGNNTRAEQHGVAWIDLGELVVVDGGAGECRHRLALRAGDEDAEF